jgi:D-xylose transport system permease protein
VPVVFLILCAVAAATHLLTQHTPFGRALFAIGGNEEAARMAGLPVENTITTAFALMGLIVALTGFLQTSYAGAATVSVGELMELDAIAACVIGGTSLKGGRGSVLGALFGAAVMATLLNGMTLLAITPEWKLIVRGTALVAAVLFDVQGSPRR